MEKVGNKTETGVGNKTETRQELDKLRNLLFYDGSEIPVVCISGIGGMGEERHSAIFRGYGSYSEEYSFKIRH